MSKQKLNFPKVNKWDLKKMENLKATFFSMICVASRRRGKSELIKYIYETLDLGNEYDHIIVLSQSEESLDHYSEFVHGDMFLKDFDDQTIEKIISISKKMEANDEPRKFLVIIDDVISDDIKHSKSIERLYAIGRHYRTSVILISQLLTNINVCARNNSDVILIGHVNTSQEKESIIKKFLDGTADPEEITNRGFKSRSSFYYHLLNSNTEDYNFLVIDQISSKKNGWENILFNVKAQMQ